MTDKELLELDAWIAEHVMGTKDLFGIKKRGYWYRPDAHGYTDRQSEAWRLPLAEAKKHEYKHGNYDERVSIVAIDIPRYSTDPAASMQVLEKCVERYSPRIFKRQSNGYFVVALDNIFSEAPTLPFAICLFAKKLFSKDK